VGEISHIMDVTASPTARRTRGASGARTLALEDVYRENAVGITAFFARRCTEAQVVADLTSQTFVEAIASAHTYAGRGSPRAWLFAIARATYARHCADRVNNTQMVQRLGGQLRWDEDELQVISGGAAALAATIAAVVLLLGATTSAPPAYALTQNPNGTVTVTLHDIATAIPALNAKFKQMGIDETVIPITADCHAIGGPPGARADPNAISEPGSMRRSFTFSEHGRPAPHGFKYVLAARQLPDGKIETWIGAIKPPLPPCFANAR
jgi:DNA-directed RNA polymerase specialized sigma24 family protein